MGSKYTVNMRNSGAWINRYIKDQAIREEFT